MLIKGIQKTTLVDYPGKIAATVFTGGCNFKCVFCHNSLLVENSSDPTVSGEQIPPEEMLDYLGGRTHQLEGVCISGGEPTLHKDLPKFIGEIKAMGYAVKLDTNGTNPEMLRQLFAAQLLDYVAMDIKGPIELYPQICNVEVNKEKILQSIELIKTSGVDHEFRTTVLPEFHKNEDAESVGCMLRGAQHYYLQQFHACESVLHPEYRSAVGYTDNELHEYASKFMPFVAKVKVRGL